MTHFFIGKPVQGSDIIMTGPEYHHLINVHRAQPGMEWWLFDEQGTQYRAQITTCNKKEAILHILERQEPTRRAFKVSLAQGLLKSKNWDLLLEKCMELGLDYLYPMLTEHVASGANSAGRSERWQKVLLAAAKQCGRSNLFPVATPKIPNEVLQETSHIPLRILAHNDPQLPSLKALLYRCDASVQEILLMVGPEGGFTSAELAAAKDKGVLLFCLGSHTLRAETAAWIIIANLHFYFEK